MTAGSRFTDGTGAPPPAKRPRHAHSPAASGLKAAIFAAGSDRKRTATTTTAAAVKNASAHRVDDSRAVVGRADGLGDVEMADARPAPIVVEIEDSESSSEDSSDKEEHENHERVPNGVPSQRDADANPRTNGWRRTPDIPEKKANRGEEAGEGEEEEPTFGEMLQSHLQEPIDVEAPFAAALAESTAVAQLPGRTLSAPSATSLGTVLGQALRTNDRELLESCFEVHDLDSVRSTIERLPSPMVGSLLHKLAERMHRRPGRAGNLMVWVQWSLVAHGGYIASQPQLTAELRGLKRVIAERARGLQPLLELKGKLDMLAAQMELRRKMQASVGGRGTDNDDDAVIYVEGEEDDDASAVAEGNEARHPRKPRRRIEAQDEAPADEEAEDDSYMALTVNGVSSDPAEDEDESANEEDLIDDEAEESENEETDEDEDDEEVEEEGEDVDSDEEAREPKRRSTAARSGFAVGR